MALITRFTRLFKADMHAVLDQLEAPLVVLRQAIREMEEQVAGGARAQRNLLTEREQAATRLAALTSNSDRQSAELDLCFEADNEALARTLIRRRLECERLATQLQQRIEQLDAAIAQHSRRLEEQRQRLEAMRQKAVLFEVADREPGEFGFDPVDSPAVSDADVELALLRARKQRQGA